MNLKRFGRLFVLVVFLVVGLVAVQHVRARQAVLVPSPEDLRFQLIGNEPIAAPDGRSLVTGWSVLVFKDRKAARCYVAFERGPAITAMESAACPAP